ncbi:VF530 family DNA-binding protein [Azonexus sp. R2A61]|uniref:VF530 family protein n=1 Tax=Azonexus sp. R2A61 TaxID=2744443 RepID=UPI001F1CF44F|nr:VF530 family protein [Azonexus sp. R2A61]
MNSQARNPLHGLTLERILNELVDECGWDTLGREIEIRCFTHDPSIASSLKFLRRTPWAREKVESFYLYVQRRKMRADKTSGG